MKKTTVLALVWMLAGSLAALVLTTAFRPPATLARVAIKEHAAAKPQGTTSDESVILSVAGYSGQPDPETGGGAIRLYAPHVARNDLLSTLFLRNLAASETAYVRVYFYRSEDGHLETYHDETIPSHGSISLELPVPPVFHGSAVIEATQPLLGVINHQHASTGSLLSYNSTPTGSLEVVLPAIMRDYDNWDTSFWVQNAGPAQAHITMTYHPYSTGNSHVATDTFDPGVSHGYGQAAMPELGSSFYGSVTVEADVPVAVVVEMWNSASGQASAYNGVPLAEADTTLFSSRQQKWVEGWVSSALIVNVEAQNAALSADWYALDGAHTWTETDTISPDGIVEYDLSAITGIPDSFDGSLVATSTRPAVALTHWLNQSALGDGFASNSAIGTGQLQLKGASSVPKMMHLPRVAHNETGGLSTEFSIQNAAAGAVAAQVTITFYHESGATTAVLVDTIPHHGVARYATGDVIALGTDWKGSVTISSTQPIAVEAMQLVVCPHPLSGVEISGPTTGYTETLHAFSAAITPCNASGPIAYTWSPGPSGGQGMANASYQWAVPGVYSITVEASNCGGTVSDTHWIPVGAAAETPVDPGQGGMLVYTDTRGLTTTVEVPPGAVGVTATLAYWPLETVTRPPLFFFTGHAFDLDAYSDGDPLPGLVFSPPATVTIHYSQTDTAGMGEDTLVLLYWTGSAWEDAACGPYGRYADEDWLNLSICHLSPFALFGKAAHIIYVPLVWRDMP
jgi:hypothetical protein